ncbi:MAG: hypothetical protein K5894_15655 [Lachnospiraceae bacterium]|nr:hypothetical protein [Lachnospiraceae bacterium]
MVTTIRKICKENAINIADTYFEKSDPEVSDFVIVSGDNYSFKDNGGEKKSLFYKNTVEILDFPNLCEKIPQLSNVEYMIRDRLPYFTAGLDKLKNAIESGKKVAVEGGPCLFGTEEVKVEIVHKDGKSYFFDYNTGKAYLEHGELSENANFAEHIRGSVSDIKAIHFQNNKTGLTSQEYYFIKYPYEMAKALGGPLVIPIPDISYVKYLDAVVSDLSPEIRGAALDEFLNVEYEITDLYLELIEQMRKLHPEVSCEVVHARDKDLVEKYYNAREPFIERSRVIRKLTGLPDRLESIKDYVSMPALPYYLYGISDIVEIDSMDETDSYRKCCFAHKGTINLSCILFPELLSKDKVHTVFESARKIKEYGRYEIS